MNLQIYATQPERFLQLQCEGECWCNPPDERANSWAGHGRRPTGCAFEERPFDEGLARALVSVRQAQAAGWPLPAIEPALTLEVVAALAHEPDWCACLPSMLARLDEVPGYLSQGWTFETFPDRDVGVAVARDWAQGAQGSRTDWLFISGGVGRGKTGLAAALAHHAVSEATRTAFLSRLSTVGEELAGQTGAELAGWLERVDLLILDDADFGWASARRGDRGIHLLADVLRTRLQAKRPLVMAAHLPLQDLLQQIDPLLRAALDRADWTSVALQDEPSLRTGRMW